MDKLEFTVDDKKYYVTFPSARQEKDAMLVFAKTLTQAIKDGIMSGDKLEQYYIEQGIWSEEKAKKRDELEKFIRDGVEVLTKKGGIKKSEAKALAIDVANKRWELMELLIDRTNFDSYTADAIAEREKTDVLIAYCTKDETGARVFSSTEDFQDRRNDPLGSAAELAFAKLTKNFDENFAKKWPENQFLIKYGFANENLELLDENGNVIKTESAEPEVQFQEFLDG